ncbi:hypothetical protein U350_00691 [Staphylococcus aureus F74039]|nr:hypothetical protein U350_00691 [Staphylococcus aureus F74039]EWU83303.1 hypothetical protein U349_00692 [Staphylococcus aureus F74035]
MSIAIIAVGSELLLGQSLIPTDNFYLKYLMKLDKMY